VSIDAIRHSPIKIVGRTRRTSASIELDRLELKVERYANRIELETCKIARCDLGPVPKVKNDPSAGTNVRGLEPCGDPLRQTRKLFPASIPDRHG
jgi:hypothetical protein